MRTPLFVAAAAITGIWTLADLLVRAISSLPRACLRLSDARYARKWGIPREALSEDAQQRVACELRCDAVRRFGVPDEQWEPFVEAHSERTEDAS
jgi:hypothetical protein